MTLNMGLYLLFLKKIQNHWAEMNAKKRNNEIDSTGKAIISAGACSCLTYHVLLL